MKIGIAYSNRPNWPKMRWVHEAFEANGHEVQRIKDGFHLSAVDKWADLCLFEQRDCGIGWKSLRNYHTKRQSRWAWWWFDLIVREHNYHVGSQTAYRSLEPVWRLFDVVFVKEATRVAEYRELGVAAEYLDQACWSGITAAEHAENPEYDVIVFGSTGAKYQHRTKDVEFLVGEGLRVVWATNGTAPQGCDQEHWLTPERLPGLMSRGAVTLSVDILHVPGFRSDRYWLAKGAGSVVITKWEDYSDHGRLLDLIRDYRSDLNKRIEVGKRNRDDTMRNHTYETRTQQLLELAIQRIDHGKEGPLPEVQWKEVGDGQGS